MAITKLNSLAIPDDTIVEADLSYPLTGFSSTGIDDNASGTKLTVDSTGISVSGAVQGDSLVAYNGLLELDDNGTHNGQINAPAALFINIDSDNTNTGEAFVIAKDRSTLSGGTELIRVTESGLMGLGTNAPSERLHIFGISGSARIRFDGDSVNAQNNYIGMDGYDNLVLAADEANTGSGSQIQMRVDATQRFVMNSAGHTTLIGSGSTNNNNTAEVLSVTGSNHVRHMISTSATNGSQASLALESNSATVAIATTGSDEMRFTTNGAEQLRINSSGNVLIGTDNGWFSASGRRILRVQGGSNGSFLVLDTSGSGDFYIESDNGGRVNLWNQANGATVFATNNTERMRILSSGGLTFNGDTASANALDDYEEGSWTPTTPNGSWTVHEATYTKIGRLVHCRGYVTASSSGITSADFGGLPFNVFGSYGSGIVGYNNYQSGEVLSVLVQANALFNFRIGQTQVGVSANGSAMFSFQYETS
jgi:hypothetical protein